MRRAFLLVFISMLLVMPSIHAQDFMYQMDDSGQLIKIDANFNEKIQSVIIETSSVQVGMTRADLLKVFTGEGGISNRTFRKYGYRGCPNIKVDVEFRPVGSAASLDENPEDVITMISKPYLEFMKAD